MSNEIVRAGQKYLAESSDNGLRKDTGKALAVVGAGGMGLWFVAGALPFITLPMLLVLAVLCGGFLYFK